jgi:hypothetical protein
MKEELHISTDDIQQRSRRRGICADIQAILDTSADLGPVRIIFGTLTYGPDFDYEPCDINLFGDAFSKWCIRKGFELRMVWVAEPHKSGKVHYHYVALIPKQFKPPMPDKRGWWKKGMSNVQWVRKNVFGYIIKYLTKPSRQFKDRYKGLRRSGARGMTGERARLRKLYRAPKWLRPEINMQSDLCKDGAFWIDRRHKRWWTSPYRFERMGVGTIVFTEGVMWTGDILEDGSFTEWDGVPIGLRDTEWGLKLIESLKG